MIIINPNTTARHAATDELRISANKYFAAQLKKYITTKKDTCLVVGDIVTTESTLANLVRVYTPQVVISIDCYTDISAASKGYNVVANAYNALVGTISYEMFTQGLTNVTETGYSITGKLQYGTVTDITIYLGFATNADDAKYLQKTTFLDLVAKRIIEGSYGPPIKALNVADNTGNADPYFYTIDTWKEVTAKEGCSGTIEETLYSGIPVRYLLLTNAFDTDYLWSIPLTYTADHTNGILLVTARSHAGTQQLRIKTKNIDFVTPVTNTTFTMFQTTGDLVPNDYIQIGSASKGALDITAVWAAKAGTLGTIDDPRTEYSIFPPGYRLTTTYSTATTPAETIHLALTTAATLITRAQDTSITETTASDTLAASSASSYSTSDYSSAVTDILSQLSIADPTKPLLVDLASIKTDYSALEASLSTITDMDKKIAVMAVINDLKTLKESQVAALTPLADKCKEAVSKFSQLKNIMTDKAGVIGAVTNSVGLTALSSLVNQRVTEYSNIATSMSKLTAGQLDKYKSDLASVTGSTKSKLQSAIPSGVTTAMGNAQGTVQALSANVAGSISQASSSITNKATSAVSDAIKK